MERGLPKSQRKHRFADQTRETYERLKKQRERRQDWQEKSASRALSQDEGPPVGTCRGMCPEFEQLERIVQRTTDTLETFGHLGHEVDRTKMVKKYRRAAAGVARDLPEDIRPPHVLKNTAKYLISLVKDSDDMFKQTNAFIWDRSRAIRKDYLMQEVRDLRSVEVQEWLARYHIVAQHLMRDVENHSLEQELEQLRNVLQALNEIYDELAKKGVYSTNEAEFRAYYMLYHMQDPEVRRKSQKWRLEVFRTREVAFARRIGALGAFPTEHAPKRRGVHAEYTFSCFSQFFRLALHPTTPYLVSCMCEIHFDPVRRAALRAMNKSYKPQHRGFPVDEIAEILGFDHPDTAAAFASHHSLPIERASDGCLTIKFKQRRPDGKLIEVDADTTFQHRRYSRKVERLRLRNVTLQSYIYGSHVSFPSDLEEYGAAGLQTGPDWAIQNVFGRTDKTFATTATCAPFTEVISTPRITTDGMPLHPMPMAVPEAGFANFGNAMAQGALLMPPQTSLENAPPSSAQMTLVSSPLGVLFTPPSVSFTASNLSGGPLQATAFPGLQKTPDFAQAPLPEPEPEPEPMRVLYSAQDVADIVMDHVLESVIDGMLKFRVNEQLVVHKVMRDIVHAQVEHSLHREASLQVADAHLIKTRRRRFFSSWKCALEKRRAVPKKSLRSLTKASVVFSRFRSARQALEGLGKVAESAHGDGSGSRRSSMTPVATPVPRRSVAPSSAERSRLLSSEVLPNQAAAVERVLAVHWETVGKIISNVCGKADMIILTWNHPLAHLEAIKFLQDVHEALVATSSSLALTVNPRNFPTRTSAEARLHLPELPEDLRRQYSLSDFSVGQEDWHEVIPAAYRRWEHWLSTYGTSAEGLGDWAITAIRQPRLQLLEPLTMILNSSGHRMKEMLAFAFSGACDRHTIDEHKRMCLESQSLLRTKCLQRWQVFSRFCARQAELDKPRRRRFRVPEQDWQPPHAAIVKRVEAILNSTRWSRKRKATQYHHHHPWHSLSKRQKTA